MKRIQILIVLLMPLAAITAQVRFDYLRQELGTLLWHQPGSATFKVYNDSSRPLSIEAVRPDCGCTVADWTRTPIAQGEYGTITVKHDAELLGHFEKQLAVYTTADSVPTFLTISGDVATERRENSGDFPYKLGDIYLNTDNLEFDDVRRGDLPTREIRLLNVSRQSFTPELMHLPKYLTAKCEPEVVRPGRTGRIYVTLNSELLRGYGLTATNVYMRRFMGDRVSRDNEVYVSVTLLPDAPDAATRSTAAPQVHLDSTSIDLGTMGDKKKLKRQLVITNTGHAPLEIEQLQVYNPGLSVSLNKRTLKPGQSVKIKITVNANTHYFKGRRRILLITNDPVHPKTVIDVKVKK